MSGLFSIFLVLILMAALSMAVWRMITGPSLVDRVIALDMLTGVAVALAALTAVTTGRREFLDIAFGVALIAFVGTCAFAGFLQRKGRSR